MVTVEIYEFVRLFFEVPIYHLILEAVLIIWVLSLILKRTKKSKSSLSEKASLWDRLSEHEKEELIQEWTPEPLVPDDADLNPIKYDVIQGKVGKHVTIGGRQYLNAATHNFLGMVGDDRVEEAAVRCLRKYGVGSCGPRAFYGTIDVHLDLEKRVTQFLGTEEAVLYSLGFSTVASAIPAYAKRSDVIFADEAVCFAIQKGLQASRSEIRYFRHNDTAHLEQLIEEHNKASKKLKPKQAALVRRFLVVEGIYANTGAVCPLPELLRLKEAHKLRLFVDESLSFGVLGDTGRGLTEHFGVTARDVDLICVSMEASLGSVGGFTTGSFYVADHQRLSGQGYVFSAALAPLCAAAAMCVIDQLDEQPEMTAKLRSVCRAMHKALANIDGLELCGDEVSPVKFLQLSKPRLERQQSEAVLQNIVDQCREAGIALTRAHYLEPEEHRLPPPAIRVTCNRLMEPEDIRSIETALTRAAGAVLG
ncbi:serine palmitoyltransferase 1-like isoform X1 [Amphibalanus amphitrite]|uniref:serine palmitoyltransferase 1-like isoform X1 n=1 Tax=Amphibalanus amphitrite TaxID=1232801 RepID=UPI001C916D45|nr:serine palmitoyltransferase 1-like isoform X1 [Amphibalanus amphitrite]XP_043215773.1 serine palmitoyltransferase 1-like isoform X1 [Amphibalanus amphitrite]XP_043215774.1 serine palmitoyltransferase 1-like isoform X1 [Amphibalanus amphitrite]